MPKEIERHYAIVYENERKTRYTIFESTDLDVLAQIYAGILQFEAIFRTFPNMSCKVVLTQDFNYDEDTGAWDMTGVVGHAWGPFVEEMKERYRGKLGVIIYKEIDSTL